jgi:hypothetical protein
VTRLVISIGQFGKNFPAAGCRKESDTAIQVLRPLAEESERYTLIAFSSAYLPTNKRLEANASETACHSMDASGGQAG